MKKLALFFPGIGYTCEKPLLYYSRKLCLNYQYDIVSLSYHTDKKDLFNNPNKLLEAKEDLYHQGCLQLEDVSFEAYDEILCISKSIGTCIAVKYAHEHHLNVKHIFYTPLEMTYQYPIKQGIAFIGTKDMWSDLQHIRLLSKEMNIPLYEYEGCNHSLETKDPLQNIDIIRDVMLKTSSIIE